MLSVFSEENGLDINTALKLANGFGGGVRCGEICGAVSGAIMAIGLKCGFYVEKDFQQKGYCNAKAYEFIQRFEEEYDFIVCRDLLGVEIRAPEDHTRPDAKIAHKDVCPKVIAAAVRILDSMDFEN